MLTRMEPWHPFYGQLVTGINVGIYLRDPEGKQKNVVGRKAL